MTPKQEEALRDYLREAVVPLIEDVLAKKLGQAMTFAKEELAQPKREWRGLTDEEITDIWAETTPYYHEDDFARAIEAKLRSKNT